MNDTTAQLQNASACLQRKDAAGCARICNALLGRHPRLWEAMHLRGLAAIQSGDTRQAITDLRAVHRAQPENSHAAFWLGRLLRQADRPEDAVSPLQQAAGNDSLEIDARYELGRTLSRLRRGTDAESQYRRILELNSEHTDAAANLAFLLERRNRLEEAGVWADRAINLDRDSFIAHLTRAVLDRRAGRLHEARARLERLAAAAGSPLNRSVALNQLGQCLDRMGEYDTAFARFRDANRILRESHPHGQPSETGSYGMARLQQLRGWLAHESLEGWTPNPHAADSDPVFLVGFPRSGTTLLDQVLSAHPEIEVCEERELFDSVRRQWMDGERFRALGAMTAAELEAARDLYFENLRAHRRHPKRPVIVDKLPLNLAYLMLIHRLFPNAPVILALRDPRDVCLSCFFQSFELQGAMPYFLDLDDTTRYYDAVMSLATETLDRIVNPLLQVHYESLVTEFEATARALIAFLGRDFVEEVLDYRRQARKRVIDTPSYQQVVQPLYARSIGRWRNYQAFIEPVSRVLAPWIERFGYARR